MKRFSALLLALLLALPGMTACSGDTGDENAPNGTETADTSAVEETEPVETVTERLSDGLPDTNLDGWTMRIISHHDALSDESTIYAYEMTGESLNDAIYERDLAIQNRFNCKFELIPGNGWADDLITLLNSVTAGTRDYDLSFMLPYASGGLVITYNLLYNMLNVEHLNMTQPWWHQDVNDQYTINGYLPFVSSDYLISSYQYANAMIYNKDVAAKYQIENLYDLVKNGTWTIDKFKELIEIPSDDADGDGLFTDADSYGFASNFGYHALTWSFTGGDVSISLNSGDIELGFSNERFYNIAERVYDILYSGNLTYEIGWDQPCDIDWDSDRVFIQAIWLADLEKFRDCESDYGILPYPKYEEAQDKYYTYVDARSGSLAIPIDAEPETISKVGLIVEALSCASHYDTLPVYIDSIQNTRYTRDEDSVEMFNYIGEGRRWDMGYMFGGDASSYVWTMADHIKDTNGQVASHLQSCTQMAITRFEEMQTAFETLANMEWDASAAEKTIEAAGDLIRD